METLFHLTVSAFTAAILYQHLVLFFSPIKQRYERINFKLRAQPPCHLG